MKGMQKIKRGSGFRGVLDYAFENNNGELDGELIGGNMSGTDPRQLAAEFSLSRKMRADIEKPVWHNSLRLPAGEKMDKDKWCKFADDYMNRMGFTDAHQRVYILHDEPEGQHIHIVASRIGLDKSLFLGKNENLQSTRTIQRLEKAHCLQITKGPSYENGKISQPALRNFTSGEYGKATRTDDQPLRYQLASQIDLALQDQPTAVQFVERLHALGITAKPNFSKETLNGFSFVIDGIPFKGSQLGNDYKGQALFTRGMTYDHQRQAQALRELTGTTRTGAIDHAAPGTAEKVGIEPASGTGGSRSGDLRQGLQRSDRSRDYAGEHSVVIADGRGKIDGQNAASGAEQSEHRSAGTDRFDQQPNAAADTATSEPGQAADARNMPGSADVSMPAGDHAPHLEGVDADSGAGPIQTGDRVADEFARKLHKAIISAAQKGIDDTNKFWEKMASYRLSEEAKKRQADQKRRSDNAREQSHIDRLMSLVATEIRAMNDVNSKNIMRMIKGFRIDELEIRAIDNQVDIEARKAPIKRTFRVEDMIKSGVIAWIKRLNAHGQDVYIRPSQPEKSGLVLVDDITQGQVAALEALGLKPAILIETSDQNHQAWIRINNDGFSRGEHAEITRLIHEKIGGDAGSRDQEHFGRLAGLTNRKPSRTLANGKSPFVLLKRYAGDLAPGGEYLLQYAHEAVQAHAIERVAASEMKLPERASGAVIPAGWLTASRERIERLVGPGVATDASQIDFRCAIELRNQNVGISEAIRLFDELPIRIRKGNNAENYALRTVTRAYAIVDLRSEGVDTRSVDLSAEAKRRYPHIFEPVQAHTVPAGLKTSNLIFATLKAEEAEKALGELKNKIDREGGDEGTIPGE